jgi:hypothetical protein
VLLALMLHDAAADGEQRYHHLVDSVAQLFKNELIFVPVAALGISCPHFHRHGSAASRCPHQPSLHVLHTLREYFFGASISKHSILL